MKITHRMRPRALVAQNRILTTSTSCFIALPVKVSRERVGCELDQMVRSASPLNAFELMDDMDLLPIVFPLPDNFVLPMDDNPKRAYEFGMVYLKVSAWPFTAVLSSFDFHWLRHLGLRHLD